MMRRLASSPVVNSADAVRCRIPPLRPLTNWNPKRYMQTASTSTIRAINFNSILCRAVQEPPAVATTSSAPLEQLNPPVDFDEEVVIGHKGLKFRLHFASRPGQQVVVTGSSKSLGSWDLQQALLLTWQEGHVWTNEEAVDVAADEDIEYKYVVTSDQQPRVLWCQGQNLAVKVPTSGQTWTLQDAWSPSTNQVLQEGLAEDSCLASSCTRDDHSGAFPATIPYKCFLCGHCLQPQLHATVQHHSAEDCPLGLSEQGAENRFLEFIEPTHDSFLDPEVSLDTDA